jgi:hypothetical protein
VLYWRERKTMTTPTRGPADLVREEQAADEAVQAVEPPDELTIHRPERARLSPEETRARMKAFAAEREEAFVAAVREDEGRSLSP